MNRKRGRKKRERKKAKERSLADIADKPLKQITL